MEHFMEGYQTYCQACENYGLESMNYHLYVKQLTEEQLYAFNEYKRDATIQEISQVLNLYFPLNV